MAHCVPGMKAGQINYATCRYKIQFCGVLMKKKLPPFFQEVLYQLVGSMTKYGHHHMRCLSAICLFNETHITLNGQNSVFFAQIFSTFMKVMRQIFNVTKEPYFEDYLHKFERKSTMIILFSNAVHFFLISSFLTFRAIDDVLKKRTNFIRTINLVLKEQGDLKNKKAKFEDQAVNLSGPMKPSKYAQFGGDCSGSQVHHFVSLKYQ